MILQDMLTCSFPIGAFWLALVPLFTKLGLGAGAAAAASTATVASLAGGGIQALRGKDIGKGMLGGAAAGLFAPLLFGSGAAGAGAGAATGTTAAGSTVPAVATGVGAGAPAAGTAAAGGAAKAGFGAAMKKGAAGALGSMMVSKAMTPEQTLTTPLGDQIGPPDFSAIEQLKQMAMQKRSPWWLTQVGGGGN